MEFMTYILWMLLLTGGVLKNYLYVPTAQRTEQAILTFYKKAALSLNEKKVEETLEIAPALNEPTRIQAYSWIDTS
jgi:hypothetical protein